VYIGLTAFDSSPYVPATAFNLVLALDASRRPVIRRTLRPASLDSRLSFWEA
jgi:hypothetical protein